jgi:Lipocalin-like domain
MKKTLITLSLASLFFISSQKPQIQNKSAQFVGTWKLVECISKETDGKTSYPFGEHPIGEIYYDPKRNMSVQIMKPGVGKFSSQNWLLATPQEAQAAYLAYLSYYGTYTVNADSNFIIHHIQASLFPNWVNQDQKRYYVFKGNQLTLTTPVIGTAQFQLTWQKVAE